MAIMVFTERVTLFLTVVTYVLMGNRLTSDVVFSVAQLFNTVQLYMAIFFPLAIATYAEAKVSVRRLEVNFFMVSFFINKYCNAFLAISYQGRKQTSSTSDYRK